MIKHSSGMVSCLKYVTNKVSSYVPLVSRQSYVFVCSRQITNNSSVSSLLLECGDGCNTFPSVATLDNPALHDSQINNGKTLKFQCYAELNRYLSFLILVTKDRYSDHPKVQTNSCSCSSQFNHSKVTCIRSQNNIIALYDGGVSPKLLGKGRFGEPLLTFSPAGIRKSVAETSENATDSLKPPSEEQLENVARTLANTLPTFFVKPLDIRIYHRNIILEDNIRGKRFSGIEQYFMQSRLLYIIGHLRFMYINLDVMKITSHPEDGTVKVRWKITVFRLSKLWRLKLFNISSSFQEAKDTWIDGFSTYFVLGDGMVHKHIVDKMIPDPDQVLKKSEPTKTVPVPNPLAYSDRNKV